MHVDSEEKTSKRLQEPELRQAATSSARQWGRKRHQKGPGQRHQVRFLKTWIRFEGHPQTQSWMVSIHLKLFLFVYFTQNRIC